MRPGDEFMDLEAAVRADQPGLDRGTVAQSVAESLGLPWTTNEWPDELRIYVTGSPGGGTYLRRPIPSEGMDLERSADRQDGAA